MTPRFNGKCSKEITSGSADMAVVASDRLGILKTTEIFFLTSLIHHFRRSRSLCIILLWFAYFLRQVETKTTLLRSPIPHRTKEDHHHRAEAEEDLDSVEIRNTAIGENRSVVGFAERDGRIQAATKVFSPECTDRDSNLGMICLVGGKIFISTTNKTNFLNRSLICIPIPM